MNILKITANTEKRSAFNWIRMERVASLGTHIKTFQESYIIFLRHIRRISASRKSLSNYLIYYRARKITRNITVISYFRKGYFAYSQVILYFRKIVFHQRQYVQRWYYAPPKWCIENKFSDNTSWPRCCNFYSLCHILYHSQLSII